jgi:hypothetical protein
VFNSQEKDSGTAAGNGFQYFMVIFTKEYLPTSVGKSAVRTFTHCRSHRRRQFSLYKIKISRCSKVIRTYTGIITVSVFSRSLFSITLLSSNPWEAHHNDTYVLCSNIHKK